MPYKEENSGRIVYYLGEIGSDFKPRSLNGHHEIQKIRKQCKTQDSALFEDQEFPANLTSIGNLKGAAEYIWKRPSEIVPSGTCEEFIVNGADRFDIIQGSGIGDCWFLAAMADLTLNDRYWKFIVPDDNSFVKNYCGAFHFRFWQYGKWIDVTVDDRLPCKKNGTLAFVSSQSHNEFWPPLLEKAYAKLNGSYEAINGGRAFTGLQDLTGGFTEMINLDFTQLKQMKIASNASELLDFMVDIQNRKSFMGSSVKSHTSKKEKKTAMGLVQGHAYSITDLKRVPVKDGSGLCIELVRLRNPWGKEYEWTGDFSDKSSCWDEYFGPVVRHELQVTYRKDGEFWMTVDDYVENFDRLEICHVLKFDTEDASTTRYGDITGNFMLGQWTRGVTAGGPRISGGQLNPTFETNPQYLLTVNSAEKRPLFLICLMKNERKAEGICEIQNVTFELYDVSKEKNPPTPLDSNFFRSNVPMMTHYPPGGIREVTCRFELAATGKYVIVPHTKITGEGGHFLLRVISIRADTTLVPFDKCLNYEGDKVEIKEMSVEEIDEMKQYKKFFKDTAGEDNGVDWWELKMLLDKTLHNEFHYEGFGFSEDECRAMVALYDSDCSGKLGFYEFAKLWCNIKKWKSVFDKFAEARDGGTKSVRTPQLGHAFEKVGYSVSKEVLARIVLRYGDRNGMLWLAKFIVASVKLEAVFEEFKKWNVDNEKKTKLSFETWLTTTMYS